MQITPTISSSSKSKHDSILISVIVPVYNATPYLARCIESILCQQHNNLEILLIDDGSTDNSWDVCQKFKAKDERVITHQQPNAGSSVARNTGLKLAKGDFIAFVDSDDWIKEKMFSSMLSFSQRHGLEVVECALTENDGKEEPKPSRYSNSFIETQEEAMERLIREKNWSVWRRIYKREILGDLRFIPGKIHQDVFFTIDIITKINNQGYLPNQFYVYNTENESITRSAYSMKKLDAKDAPYYVVNATKRYNETIRNLASKYLVGTLLSHYDRLFTHSYLDTDLEHRKTIRQEIKTQLSLEYQNSSIFAQLAKFLPIWLYGWVLKINALRIEIKRTLLKL